ncbi:hypothetical protein SS50377_27599 [Spironucleus salmonicida]|uniref:Uncharacterized protein n=1 Tax=Spironucleus salmonicida TaxID=348837 RepID=V6LQU8_9EUKA|nr:hypothetical protein SS50377_27599 [Spironucleus salmonicida]|eukprot:EST46623.1 Hypothetical protein SS50377_13426 [Spironucleus salmonicida]
MLKIILDFLFCRKRCAKKSLISTQVHTYTQIQPIQVRTLNANQISQINNSICTLLRIQQRATAKLLAINCQNTFLKTIGMSQGHYIQVYVDKQSADQQNFMCQIDALVSQLPDKFEQKALIDKQISVVNNVFIQFLQRFDLVLQEKIYFQKLQKIDEKINELNKKIHSK